MMDRRWRVAYALVALGVLAGLVPPAAAQPAQFAAPPFQQLWQRYDLPVAAQQTTRSWTWGPNTFFIGGEPYVEAPGGQRVVQYFDKTRMELNNPATGVVTNGLLVREMVSGRLALGDVAFEQRVPASQAVAGDPAEINPYAPAYADFGSYASIDAERRAPNRTGQQVDQAIARNVPVFTIDRSRFDPGNVIYAYYEPTLGHNMPNVFLDFVNQRGTVYVNGQFVPDQPVFEPWTSVMGLPIVEPYWTIAYVGGQPRVLLVQLFERRVLTYDRANPAGFQVEMGNVGQHYYAWRTQPPPAPPPPPPPPPAAPVFTEGPTRTALTATSATIEWETDQPTTGYVDFDTDPNQEPFRNRTGSGALQTDHVVTLSGLAPDTTYYWRVVSQNSQGLGVREETHSFRTPPASGGGTTITTPASGQRIASPLTVSGQEDGTAPGGTLAVRLRDTRTGYIYASQVTTVQSSGPGVPGPYSATLYFALPATDQPAVVEVVSPPVQAGQVEQLKATVNVVVAGSGAPTPTPTPTPPPGPTPTPPPGPTATPTPPPPPGGSNTISRPSHQQRVGSPLRVVGTVDSTVVGGNIVVQIRDRTTNQVVASQPGTANSRGEFDVLIDYPLPAQNTPGVVEVVAPQTTTGQTNVIKVSVEIVMAGTA
jgi:hypothetical protein